MSLQLGQVVHDVRALVRTSAPHGLKFYRSNDVRVRTKRDSTPASDADDAIGLFLRAELLRRYGFPVVMEETVDEDLDVFRTNQFDPEGYLWWVDPIDGTKNFLVADDEFSILVGLTFQRRPVLGVIFVPMKDELYFAAEGHGAWREHAGSVTRVATCPAAERVLLTKFPSDAGKLRALEYYRGRGYAADHVVQIGSAYKSGLVAAGEYAEAVSFDDFSLWDVCAPAAILQEAGGVMLEMPQERPFVFDPLGDVARHGYSARAA